MLRSSFGLSILVALSACDSTKEPAPGDTADACIGQPEACDEDGDGFRPSDGDCDDADADVNPGAHEDCDGRDQDCDGLVDEDVQSTWFRDADGDGFGDPDGPRDACEVSVGYVATGTDCNDGDATAYPAANELCDGVDNDCDTFIDEEVMETFYLDADADGDGDPNTPTEACSPPDGYVAQGDDCDDGRADLNTQADELCDGLDNDCDGNVDEPDAADATLFWSDLDGDGFGDDASTTTACTLPDGYVANNLDCNDGQASIHPDADELCDGIDNDCDAVVDEDDALDATLWFADADRDGYGDASSTYAACTLPSGYVTDADDCDDADAAIHPSATERCDAADNDCDGTIDEPDAVDATWWYEDADGDAHGSPALSVPACAAPAGFVASDDDCEDADAAINPGAAEICDEADNDCDGGTDEGLPLYLQYEDADVDGYGDSSVSLRDCAVSAGWATTGGDCDDASAAVYPGAAEVCDDVDQDCDGTPDDGLPTLDGYTDADADGYGDPDTLVSDCALASGSVTDADDCDDADAAVHPGGTEICDGLDNDCDGTVDEGVTTTWYADADADGFGAASVTSEACTLPSGHVANADDCDDASAASWPGAAEICDGEDNDCDGSVDESIATTAWYADTDGDTYGDPASSTSACAAPAGYVADDTDCDDADSDVYPTAVEIPGDGVDQSCDGSDSCDDLDCDGIPDVVLPSGSASGTSYVYYGTGTGYDITARDALTTYTVQKAIADDVDGDGYQDLLFLNYSDGSIYTRGAYLFWGSAAGYSDADKTTLPASAPTNAQIMDLDDDGYKDIVITNVYSATSSYVQSSYVYWGSSAGFSTSARTSLETANAWGLVVEDLDGDGWPDIVVTSQYSSTSLSTNSYVYWGSSSGYSSSDRTSLPTVGAGFVVVDDVDGDGHPDLLFGGGYSGSWSRNGYVYIYYGSSSGYSSARSASIAVTGLSGITTSDLDQDGWTDLVACSAYTTAGLRTTTSYVYWGDSVGYTTASRTGFTTYGCQEAEIGDLDGDSWDDLIFVNYHDDASYYVASELYWGSSSGYSTRYMTSLYNYGASGVEIGDMDQDGYDDLLSSAYTDGSSSSVDSRVFWGSSAGYSTGDRDSLAGVSAVSPLIVGAD